MVGELRRAFALFNGVAEYKLVCVVPTFSTSGDGSVVSTTNCLDAGVGNGFERLTK